MQQKNTPYNGEKKLAVEADNQLIALLTRVALNW